MEWVKLVESKREEIVNAGLTAWKNNLNAERIVEVYMTPEGTIDYSTYLHGDNARIPKSITVRFLQYYHSKRKTHNPDHILKYEKRSR